MSLILEVLELSKHFKTVKAVNGISFQIEAGTCFGLLGPNGAGKTTTIEMIEGIITPSSGEILYKGKPCDSHFKTQAGIQFQSTSLMDYLTVAEVLALFASFYPSPLPTERLVKICHLGEFLHQPAARLSGGQRQRVLLAVALINDPEIVFLDEPTTGLDPQSRRNFWRLIKDIKAQGKTVVLTTHYMDEAQQLCDQLVIIDRGKIIAKGSPKQLLDEHFDHVLVCLDIEAFPEHMAEHMIDEQTYTQQGEQIAIQSHSVEETLNKLIANNISLNSLQVRNPTLDDLFLKLTGHSLRE